MRLLDRYVLRNFLEPFLLCFFGFLSIWLVFDLSDNLNDFMQAHAGLKTIAQFYLTQLPQIVIISLPVGVLLGLLFALSRMSRRNEIISMLTAGVSLWRVALPLIAAGVVTSGALLALNYQLAPHAEAVKKTALEQIARKQKPGEVASVNGYLFRDRMNFRTWFISKFSPQAMRLSGVHITQQDASGRILKKWYARGAIYDPRTKSWSLNRGIAVEFDEKGDQSEVDNFETDFRVQHDWSETPWRIASARSDARHLTVPELQEYLNFNSDFREAQLAAYRTYLNNRLAQPFQCLVVVLFAAPLAIVFSRRGMLGGIATAMLLYAGLFLTTEFFLAMGKGARIDARVAAWFPNALFAVIGIVLLYLKGSNREFPKLFGK